LLKTGSLIVLFWGLFLCARITLTVPPTSHLSLIPTKVEALAIINNRCLGEKLLYQRVFNSTVYKEKITLDSDLERQLIRALISSKINLLSPIAVFSYQEQDDKIYGLACQASSEPDLRGFIHEYLNRLNLNFKYDVKIRDNQALILMSNTLPQEGLGVEIHNILKGKFGSISEEEWFKMLDFNNHDIVTVLKRNEQTITNSDIVSWIPKSIGNIVTNIDINASGVEMYTYVLTQSSNHTFAEVNSKQISGYKDGFNLSFGGQFVDQLRLLLQNFNYSIPTDSGKVSVELSQLLEDGIAISFESVTLDYKELINQLVPVDFVGAFGIKYDK